MPLLIYTLSATVGPVQSDNGTIRRVGHKTVLLPLRCIWLK